MSRLITSGFSRVMEAPDLEETELTGVPPSGGLPSSAGEIAMVDILRVDCGGLC